MATQPLTFLIPPYGSATLSLPDRLSPDAFTRLERAVEAALAAPPEAQLPAAADPGAVEYDSWSPTLTKQAVAA